MVLEHQHRCGVGMQHVRLKCTLVERGRRLTSCWHWQARWQQSDLDMGYLEARHITHEVHCVATVSVRGHRHELWFELCLAQELRNHCRSGCLHIASATYVDGMSR